MRNAKSGAWWNTHPHRALSNNSAVYTEKPEIGLFMREWLALYESKSGERGIFNREAATKQATKYGKRDASVAYGCNPCSEILLRPYSFCNLSEIISRPSDTVRTLKKKVRTATILGTYQSSLTYFPYLRKIWQRNAEEERLLGVSLTGIYDNPLLNNWRDPDLPKLLEELRIHAEEVNAEWAEKLGIPPSAAITCVKPSGTVSSLVNAASGIHPRHARYYYRRVRGDVKDPLTKFMIEKGIPAEPDVVSPNNIMVFTFPMKAPTDAVLRNDISAIDHLNLWLIYQRHWCHHKPSVTVSVKEDEWLSVGSWVWEHFDELSGVSFLPYDGGTYRQAPFEECTEEQYDELAAKMPKNIDWDSLIEEDDNVEGAQQLACVAAGGCEV
jgi:ribonucleoside-diphosphate reductase alpha chain